MELRLKHILILLAFLSSCSQQINYLFLSPDGELEIIISNIDNSSVFTVVSNQDTILNQSPLGLQVNETSLIENVSFSNYSKAEYDETWTTVNAKQPTVRNHYNEYVLSVTKPKRSTLIYEIVFRVYDNGFAYRYIFPPEAIADSVKIEKELTNLHFNGDYTYWAYNGEHHNLGPVVRSEENREKQIGIPVVFRLHNNSFMAIHEAEIIEFAPFSIDASARDKSIGFSIDYSSRSQTFKT